VAWNEFGRHGKAIALAALKFFLCNRLVTFIFVADRLHKYPVMRRDVFQAIADPTRRAIIQLLAQQSLNLNAVAENFEISRPAVSKQIKILTECGLLVIRKKGRERFCEANLGPLGQVDRWMDPYRKFWTYKLDALEQYLESQTFLPEKKKHGGKPKKKTNKKKRK
jgi:DNA-binding transcriptional ArsR family regulator